VTEVEMGKIKKTEREFLLKRLAGEEPQMQFNFNQIAEQLTSKKEPASVGRKGGGVQGDDTINNELHAKGGLGEGGGRLTQAKMSRLQLQTRLPLAKTT